MADDHALAEARRALAAARLPFAPAVDADETAAMLARLLALIGARLGTPTRTKLPGREVAALLRAATALLAAEHRLRDAVDGPPPLPVEYLDRLQAWSQRAGIASGRGAPGRGTPFGARVMLSLYVRAFGRRPAPTIDGPAHRFLVECLRIVGAAGSRHHRAKLMIACASDVTADECLAFLQEHEPFESWFSRAIKEAWSSP